MDVIEVVCSELTNCNVFDVMLKQRQPTLSKNGVVVITVDGRNNRRGNTTAWTKLVMSLSPQESSTAYVHICISYIAR